MRLAILLLCSIQPEPLRCISKHVRITKAATLLVLLCSSSCAAVPLLSIVLFPSASLLLVDLSHSGANVLLHLVGQMAFSWLQ